MCVCVLCLAGLVLCVWFVMVGSLGSVRVCVFLLVVSCVLMVVCLCVLGVWCVCVWGLSGFGLGLCELGLSWVCELLGRASWVRGSCSWVLRVLMVLCVGCVCVGFVGLGCVGGLGGLGGLRWCWALFFLSHAGCCGTVKVALYLSISWTGK